MEGWESDLFWGLAYSVGDHEQRRVVAQAAVEEFELEDKGAGHAY